MLALGQRHLGVGIGAVALSRRNEQLAWHPPHDGQHALIEHLPGAHLLLDHLFARVRRRLHPGPPRLNLLLRLKRPEKLRVFMGAAKPPCDEIW